MIINTRRMLFALCLGLPVLAAQAADAPGSLFYIGTRGVPQTTPGPLGIHAARLDTQTGKLTLLGQQSDVPSVSWLLMHPSRPILYMAANPGGSVAVESQLYTYAVDKATGKLTLLKQIGTGGRDTTHLDFDTRSSTLFGASHGSGEDTALPVKPDGTPEMAASSARHYGVGPLPRQSFSQSHAVALDPSGRFLLAPDLGADRIFVSQFDGATRVLTPAATPYESAPPGSGPRHLVFHPNGRFVYVNTEMSAELRAYKWDAKLGQMQLLQAQSAYPAGYAKNDKSSAEIGFSRDGRHLYVSLRGDQDSIVVYDVDAKTGNFKETQRIATQGKSPRSFAIDPTGRWMVVVHDVSNTVNVFALDKVTGKLTPTGDPVSVPTAACVVFAGG